MHASEVRTVYHFEAFQLDPVRRTLSSGGQQPAVRVVQAIRDRRRAKNL